ALEVAGDRASRRIRHGDVGDVDAAAYHVVQAAAGLAHAPRGDPHDGIDLSGDVAHAMDVALPVDSGRARLQHGVADAYGARVVRKLLERAAGGNVEPTWWRHAGHGTSDGPPERGPPGAQNTTSRATGPLPQPAKITIKPCAALTS